MIASSSGVHGSLTISGFRWLYHRSLHCFPNRPESDFAMTDQLFTPSDSTRFLTILSSSAVHGPFTNPGLRTFCHRCRHCTSVLSSICSEIIFQFFPLKFFTAVRNFSSSSVVQAFPRFCPSSGDTQPTFFRVGVSELALVSIIKLDGTTGSLGCCDCVAGCCVAVGC